MEEELKCPFCRKFLEDPILLLCGHSYCRKCALKVQQPSSTTRPSTPGTSQPGIFPQLHNFSVSPQCSSGASDTMSICVSDPDHESDKLSILSETDSGVVVCGRVSRPSSIVGPPLPRLPNILTPSTSGVQLACGVCQKPSYFADDLAISNAPANLAIQNVISRYLAQHPNLAPINNQQEPEEKENPICQLCEGNIRPATVFCEQCDIFYCQSCQTALHPSRGPLAKHTLISAGQRRIASTRVSRDVKCAVHRQETLSMYCVPCRCPVCCLCLQDARHSSHDVQALAATLCLYDCLSLSATT